MIIPLRHFSRLLFLVFLMALLPACDNPVDDDDDDHAEVEGLALFMGGVEIVTVAEAGVTGSIQPAAGARTGLISIQFRDHDGDPIGEADLDDEFSLGWNVLHPSVAEFEQEGRWSFRINGLLPGTTQLTLQLLHAGHPDFTTPQIPVEVTQ